MTLNDIMRRVRERENPEDAKVLWHLHSLDAEPGALAAFASRLDSAFDEQPKRWSKANCLAGCYGNTAYALQRICTPGESVSRSFFAFIREAIAQDSQAAAQHFYLTNIGRLVWESLDWCLEERRPCFIEGREGRGKSASASAWWKAHRGQARYVSLPGLGVQRDFFNVLALAYDVPFLNAKSPGQVRWRVRDAVVNSGLVLVIDEAHAALPERHRQGCPPLIDWIDRDLCNAGVAVALISTPQFGPRLAEFEERTNWNAGQFRRRFSGRWTRLADKTDEADLAALAKRVMPQIGSKGISLAVGYAGAFDRDVSGLFDLVRDAERRARKAGRQSVTLQDLREAYKLDRVPSENALAAAFKRPVHQRPERADAELLPVEVELPADPMQRRGTTVAVPDFSPTARVGREPELVS